MVVDVKGNGLLQDVSKTAGNAGIQMGKNGSDEAARSRAASGWDDED